MRQMITRGPIAFLGRPDKKRLAVSIGDSTVAGVATVVPSGLTCVGDLVTAAAAGHSVMTGSRILSSRADQAQYNGYAVVESSNASGFTFRAPNGRPNILTATSALGFQIRMLDAWSGTNILAIASAMAKCVFNDIINLSVGSESAADTEARFSQALVFEPCLIEIRTGINSINSDVVASSIFTSIKRMCLQAINKGIVVVLHTVGPLGSAHASYTAARLQEINSLNDMIRQFSWMYSESVILLDTNALWINSTNTSGDWKSGYSTDFIHPLSKASYYAAKELYPELQRRFSRIVWPICSVTDDVVDDADNLNLFEFGLCTGSAGTITAATGNSGTISDGLSATVVSTPVTTVNTHGQTRDDGIGFDNQCVITANSNGDGINFPVTSANLHQRFDDYPGRYTQSGVNFKLVSTDVDLANVQFSWNITEATIARTVNGMNGLVIPAGETVDMWFITPPVKIPAGTLASVRPRLTCTLSGSGVATIKHGRYFSRVLPNNLEQ